MPENAILAKNVKGLRNKMGQTQEAFAAGCDLSKEIISLIERGKSDPKLSTVKKIAAYTASTVAELYTDYPD